MKDPYEILGVGRNATDEEIKKAYREKAKMYHPDNYTGGPEYESAEDKMQEINDAYDTIMAERKGDGQSGNFAQIRSLINAGRIDEAQSLLDAVPISSRTAEWYFLNGSVQYKRGYFDGAYSSFSTASRMEPGNAEYSAAFNNMQRNTNMYRGNPYRTGGNMGGTDDCCNCCQSVICADCLCEMCGGNLCPCIGCR